MELYLLTINVTGQKLTLAESADIYSGDKNIDSVQFVFTDSKWDSMTEKWAIFKRYGSDEYQVSLDNTNKAVIPAEVMQTKGYIYIGLLGTDGDEDVQTSSVLQYKLGEGVINENGITPPGDIYSQFLSDLDAYQTAVSELASIEARITTAEGDVSAIETDVDSLETRADAIETELTNSEATFEGYISRATEQADRSEYYADLSEQSANRSGYLQFEINESGHLIMTRVNAPVTFALNNGHLILTEVA